MRIAISGPSCSGKTTLARALVRFLTDSSSNRVTLLHQDDFYLPEADIPSIKCAAPDGDPTKAIDRECSPTEFVNWDCPEALDMASFTRIVESFDKDKGFPEDIQRELASRSKEDQNGPSTTNVSESLLHNDKIAFDEHILVVDGFMLYYDEGLIDLFDIAFLVRGTHSVLKQRREARTSYATLEGTWQDPPGFFDQVVWAEYKRTHAHLFQDGDVEGNLLNKRLKSPTLDADLDTAFTFILQELKSLTS
ncbi:P-loop containing nucleoside triphosphate hydrolase protein [Protomyces lactucae-debilis]|uniref:p-loop containing nucleoside triphosphate hydrolase protein n=1 Tax=Protomyces lactucae-debilis TaxID=2754530 RepID=A0A1Y2EV46_PROLT|nr:P-loop containing nucleoside triphosphate hydrolase protein [Protomyces lactucae-debilis]ORY75440.1 P-loop containing nucleoside triphosphate hydrolase protein [Protomyces lactucae-debilis]